MIMATPYPAPRDEASCSRDFTMPTSQAHELPNQATQPTGFVGPSATARPPQLDSGALLGRQR